MAAAQASEGTWDPAGVATVSSGVVHVECSALNSQCELKLECHGWMAVSQGIPRAIVEKGRREGYLLSPLNDARLNASRTFVIDQFIYSLLTGHILHFRSPPICPPSLDLTKYSSERKRRGKWPAIRTNGQRPKSK